MSAARRRGRPSKTSFALLLQERMEDTAARQIDAEEQLTRVADGIDDIRRVLASIDCVLDVQKTYANALVAHVRAERRRFTLDTAVFERVRLLTGGPEAA